MSAREDVVVRIEKLSKQYGLPLPKILKRGVSWLRLFHNHGLPTREEIDGQWALRDIDLEIRGGETLGIIGANGAGKSTLLKVLAGVTPPTLGRVEVKGRVFPMIELNAGLHMELTGRENVRLLGGIMGLSTGRMTERMPDIESFCELGAWFDRPVRKYSSGMLARLGFAVAMNVDAEILLVDEVLAVGDITFQRKCFERMEQLHNSGKTVVFVSHAIRQVERLCDRVMLLDDGASVACGETTEVISKYYDAANLRIINQRLPTGDTVRVIQSTLADAVVEVMDIRLRNAKEEEARSFFTGEPMTIEVDYQAHKRVDRAIVGMGIATVDSFYVSGFTNEHCPGKMSLAGRGTFRCTIMSLPLLSGIYTIQVKIRHPNGSVLGGGYGLATFAVQVPGEVRRSSDYGIVKMDVNWGNEHSDDSHLAGEINDATFRNPV